MKKACKGTDLFLLVQILGDLSEKYSFFMGISLWFQLFFVSLQGEMKN